MSIDDVIAVLIPLAAVATVGTALAEVWTWLKGRRATGTDPRLAEALGQLPATATADEIVRVVTPFMQSVGGNANLSGGNDGGGNVNASNVSVLGGAGATKGGNATVKGGDGGKHGKGGDVIITGGVIKGGDADSDMAQDT